MALEDINAGEDEGEGIMNKWAKPIFWFFASFGIGINIYAQIYDYTERNGMNKEIQEIRKIYHQKEEHQTYSIRMQG